MPQLWPFVNSRDVPRLPHPYQVACQATAAQSARFVRLAIGRPAAPARARQRPAPPAPPARRRLGPARRRSQTASQVRVVSCIRCGPALALQAGAFRPPILVGDNPLDRGSGKIRRHQHLPVPCACFTLPAAPPQHAALLMLRHTNAVSRLKTLHLSAPAVFALPPQRLAAS